MFSQLKLLILSRNNKHCYNMETNYKIELEDGGIPTLPSFTHSTTLAIRRADPRWIRAKDAVETLREAGVSTTTQTLFNLERNGILTTRRAGPRQVWFMMGEIERHFKIDLI